MHRLRSNTKHGKIGAYLDFVFMWRGVLHIHGIEVIETFFECQSMIFCFNHLDNIKLPYFVKFLVGSFHNLFTKLPKWFLLCRNEVINMLKDDMALFGDWHTKL